jgi:hypothetical protein
MKLFSKKNSDYEKKKIVEIFQKEIASAMCHKANPFSSFHTSRKPKHVCDLYLKYEHEITRRNSSH